LGCVAATCGLHDGYGSRTVPTSLAFLSHPSSLRHDTGDHPECAARIIAIEAELDARGWFGFERVESEQVERRQLEHVHPAAQIEAIERVCLAGGGMLDADTIVSPGSFEAALHAAGGAVGMVTRLLADGAGAVGFSAHRPPGHHALADRAMGFCLFNNIAVAAAVALEELGLERVMIIDWDVHHGNGTQDIFWEFDQVLFASLHQMPLYPGSGAAEESGAGAGRGFTLNVPMSPGSGDAEWVGALRDVVVPQGIAFAPQLVLVSAGFDAHRDEPLANCEMTEAGYVEMARLVRGLAAAVQAPLGLVLEGGYNLGALARSVAAVMAELASG
jgi:acetoin utilization deacetylase AcuC-like enzyme